MFNPVPATEARHWQDWLVLQDWDGFSSEDHATWDLLYARQVPHLEGHVVLSPPPDLARKVSRLPLRLFVAATDEPSG